MKKVIIISFVLLLVGGLIFYRINSNNKKNAANGMAPGKSTAKVFGRVIQGQEFSDFVSLSGSIEPNEQVDIYSEVSGLVESINFEEGSRVTQGQVLLTVNDAELRAQLSQAQTMRNLAAENERRAKLLLEKEAISQEEYDIASADFRTSESQIQLIQAQLRKTVVKAPFSGTIGLRNISKGTFINSTINVAQLVNTARVKLLFAIPEKYAHKVKVNTPIAFNIQGSTETYAATVYALQPSIESSTRTLQVKAIADNKGNNLIPGTFANIIFPLETLSDGILVPAEALIPIQNGKKVFVMLNGKAKEVIVQTGARTEDDVLVTSGLQIGDTVLTSGVMSLRDGAAVHVTLR